MVPGQNGFYLFDDIKALFFIDGDVAGDCVDEEPAEGNCGGGPLTLVVGGHAELSHYLIGFAEVLGELLEALGAGASS